MNRKRIGLCYTYNVNWIGGTYYIENLVNALNSLPDAEKPHIVLITDNQKDRRAANDKIRYPYLSHQLGSGERNLIFQLFNKASGRILGMKIFPQKIQNLDAVFPYYKCVQQSAAKKKIYWIADFQEHFAAEFFSVEAIAQRREVQTEIKASSENLIVSSLDAFEQFKALYPEHTVSISVLPFAVSHPDYRSISIASILEKYKLPPRYFICPNQFWKHKNQILVLKAVRLLREKGIHLTVVFTGNTTDYRNPEYFDGLNDFVKANQLDELVRFLGFIDRAEQLQLMNNSVAIIQPSLFEGWSTVVEDAKLMNKFLIVSDINIHKEQLIDSAALFFDPLDEQTLATAMDGTYFQIEVPALYENPVYLDSVKTFGYNFLQIATGIGSA